MAEPQRKRIAFIAGTLGRGGAEQQLHHMVTALVEAGHAVAVFTLAQGEYWEDRIRATGAPVHHCGGSGNRPARIVALLRAIAPFEPDIIQSQHFYTNMHAALVARMLAKPCIGGLRSTLHHSIATTGRPWGLLCFHLPDVVLANSCYAIDEASSLEPGCSRVRYIPNVIDTDHFHPIRREPRSAFTMLAVGRMTGEKRFDRAIDVTRNVRERFPVRLILVGDGPLMSELQLHAHRVGLTSDECVFVGAQDDTREWYQQADVLLSLSEYEGTPNVVMEAMACGLPVIASAVGDVPTLLNADWIVDIQEERLNLQATQLATVLGLSITLRHAAGIENRKRILDGHNRMELLERLGTIYGQC